MALTEVQIRNTKPQATAYKLADGEGLYLLVQPGGSKLWRLKYRFGGKENVHSIGQYPLVSLAEAREQRMAAKKLLKANIDPNAQKKDAKRRSALDAVNSFKAVAEDWHKTNLRKWTPEHAEKIKRRLELHAFPQLGSRPIASIKTPELIPLLRKVEKNGKADTAGRLVQTLNNVFRYAVHSGIIEQNPAADLRGVITPYEKKHFPAIRPNELPEMLEKLEVTDTTLQNRIAMKLLLHTVLRPGELRHSLWSDIDWEKRQWNIPAERMKKRRPHVVPLSSQALTLLKELHALTGHGEYMFPSQQRRKHPMMSENTINKILTNMGYKGRLVGHGFRAIASTAMNDSAKFRPDVIEAQLSHVEQDNSRKPYNRAEYMEERKPMMQWWSNYIEEAAQGKVVNIKKQKAS